MASRWLPIIFALEIESAGWQANGSVGDTQAYPRDEHCQSAVGSASAPWRVAQARRRYRTDQRGQVHGQATRPAVPRLEDIPPQLLLCYMKYYNGARTPLSLEKDAP